MEQLTLIKTNSGDGLNSYYQAIKNVSESFNKEYFLDAECGYFNSKGKGASFTKPALKKLPFKASMEEGKFLTLLATDSRQSCSIQQLKKIGKNYYRISDTTGTAFCAGIAKQIYAADFERGRFKDGEGNISRLNPFFFEKFMGFPEGWTAC